MKKTCGAMMLIMIGGILVFLPWGPGANLSAGEAQDQQATEPSLILSLSERFSKTERPPVLFPHNQHVTALEQQGCSACHSQNDEGAFSYTYPPVIKGDSKNAYRQAFHQHCIGCHKNPELVGNTKPPVTCGECHARKPKAQGITDLQWPDAGLDYYSHALHVDAAGEDCGACHHTGDMTSCRDCHRAGSDSEAPPYRQAAHTTCVKCHLESGAGSTSCAGCHSEKKRWKAEDIAQAQRPEIGQPDSIVITTEQAALEGVPFNHQSHEEYTAACRTCHHNTMMSCESCHTVPGSEQGGMVTLASAYHQEKTDRSCAGCHNDRKKATDCAGCHATMQKSTNQNACGGCHRGPAPIAAPDQGDASALLPDNLPPEVIIEAIKTPNDKYLPAQFSHRAHIDTLTRISDGSSLARYFHTDPMTICAGCHHQSPLVPKKPVPSCSSCHTLAMEPRGQVPTLYGAYHRQCLGCHETMHVEPVSCTGCHQEKETGLSAEKQ